MERESAVLSLVLLIASLGYGQENVCGDGPEEDWVFEGGFCYFIYREHSYVTWSKALDYCQEMQTSLLSIHTEMEAGFLINITQLQRTNQAETCFWTGLKSNKSGDIYSWSDGTGAADFKRISKLSLNSSNEEYCVYLNGSNGTWDTANCETEMLFICKKEVKRKDFQTEGTLVKDDVNFCPKNWQPFGNNCYTVSRNEQRMTWSESKENCEILSSNFGNFGHLMTIPDNDTRDFAAALLQNYTFDVWIGIRYYDNTETAPWTDGRNSNQEHQTVQSRRKCTALKYDGNRKISWKFEDCNILKRYVCEMSGGATMYTSAELPTPPDEGAVIDTPAELSTTSDEGEVRAGILFGIIMGSIFSLFVVFTAGFMIYKRRSLGSTRFLIMRNRIFSRQRTDTRLLM